MKKIIEISLSVALVLSIVLSVSDFKNGCNSLRNDVLRLHVIANSDSDADQQVKLKVRDALLQCGSNLFSGNTNVTDAEELLRIEKVELIKESDRVLEENGFGYKTKIEFTEEYFPTRTYETYTLPAGNYHAIKVILGKGEGHNWWCVMFPPLCLPAATEDEDIDLYLTKDSQKIIRSKPDYEIRFKIVEIIEKLKSKIKNT